MTDPAVTWRRAGRSQAPEYCRLAGPVDNVVIEFAEAKWNGEALPILLDLVAKGTIRILDAVAGVCASTSTTDATPANESHCPTSKAALSELATLKEGGVQW